MYQDDSNGGGGPQYVHIDFSDQFSKFGKYVVTFVWFVSFIVINYCNCKNNKNNKSCWKVALTSAIIMVWVRHLLQIFGSHGPQLNVYRQIYIEPAIFFVSGSLLQTTLLRQTKTNVSLFDHDHNNKQKQQYYNNPHQKKYSWKHYINIILISIVSSISITEDSATSLFLLISGSRDATESSSSSTIYHHLCWKIGTSIAGLLSYTSNFATFVVITASYDVITWRQYFVNLFVPAIILLVMSSSMLLLLPGTTSTDDTTRNNNNNNVAYVLTRKEDDDVDDDDDEGNVLEEGGNYLVGQHYDLELQTIDTNNGTTTTTGKVVSISNDDMNMNSTYNTDTTKQQETSSNTQHQKQQEEIDDPLLFMSENPSSPSLLNNITDDDDDDDDSKPSWFLVYGLPFIGLPIAFFICNGQNILWIALTFTILMIWIIGEEGKGKGSFNCCFQNNCNNSQQQQQQPSSTTGNNSVDDTNNTFWSYIDLKPLLLYISWCILTGSLADTGVPQMFMNVAMGTCADQMTSPTCIYKFAFVVYAMSICLSPLVTVIVLLCTFPYASPYDWIQVIVAISIGKFARSSWTLMTSSPPPTTTTTRYDDDAGGGASVVAEGSCAATTTSWGTIIVWRICVVTISLFVLWVATSFVQNFHTVYECSVRLGECDDMGSWGGWKK